jgi:hypothetical protein
VNNTTLMTRTLQSKGFRVTTLKNGTRRQMIEAIRTFTGSLEEESVGLFYFAGHGIEFAGNHYLIPVDANIESEADVEFESINAGRVLASLKQSNNGLNLVVLDACRNNPYVKSFRSSSRGLSRMQPVSGSLILYATEPSSVAADGDGDNGVFTKHLVDAINQHGNKIEEIFKITARNVNKATAKKQTRYIEGVLLGEFYFGRKKIEPPKPTVADVDARKRLLENEFWRVVKSDQSIAMYQAYLSKFPIGLYAPIAKAKVQQSNDLKLIDLVLLETEIANKAKQEKVLELLSIADSLYENGDFGYAKIQYQSILYLGPDAEMKALALDGMKNTEQALLEFNGNTAGEEAKLSETLAPNKRFSRADISDITTDYALIFKKNPKQKSR